METETSFIPIDYDYFDWQGQNYVKIIGRSKEGKRICIIDRFEPSFWVILKPKIKTSKIEQIEKEIKTIKIKSPSRITTVLKTEIHKKNFLGKPYKAIKVFISNYKDAHDVADKIGQKEVEARREYDLPLITKYIIDKKLKPLCWYKIRGEVLNNSLEFGGIDSVLEVDNCIKVEKIELLEKQLPFTPKILAYDIETNEIEIGKGEILMISLVGENFKKVLTWKKEGGKVENVEVFKDEADMLEGFVKHVKEQEPDILAGYFSDGFDLPYLRARAQENRVKLSLGLDGSQPKFSRGRVLTGKINGIVHVDLLRFIRTVYSQYLKSETLSLNEVASELLGEKKNDFSPYESLKSKKIDWKEFFSYNLQDSVLTYNLTDKLWFDLLELTKIVEEPLFNISRAGLSNLVENYILHNLEKFNEIAEKRPIHEEIGKRRMRRSVEGAFVFEPIPGFYNNLAVFDFTSMHTSIMVSFNISKATLLEKKEINSYESPGLEFEKKKTKFYFSKKPGFFALLLKEIFEKRKQFKQEYKQSPGPLTKARSNVFKILSASVHGYQGFFGARYYSLEASASVLAFVRKFNKEIIEKADKAGYKVIYGDSISGNTKVIIKKDNKIYEDNIENLFKKVDSKTNLGKEYNFKKNIDILTLDDKGKSIFKPLIYVMRHKCKKEMYRVNFTNNWHIDVTEDHSLMGYQKYHQSKENRKNPLKRIIEIKPNEIKKKANSMITLKKIPEENPKTKDYPLKVYEFMGFFIGDGSFIRNKSHQKYNKDYYLRLSLGSDKEEIFDKLIVPLKKLGYIKSHWWSKTRQGDLTINGLKLVNLIAENCRDKNNKKAIPQWLFNEKEENIRAFLRGLFSADGSVMIRNNAPIIKYTSICKYHIEEVRKLLYRVGISHSVFKENSINKYKTKNKTHSTGSFSKNIILKDREQFAREIYFLLERKNKLANIKTNAQKYKFIKGFDFNLQSVKSIEEIKTPKYVYDLEVEDTHTFFANYVLAHNTDSTCFQLGKHTQKQTKEFLKKLNKQLPGIMELDLEDFYKRGIWVTKRGGEFGAKKKYALIDEKNNIKIRGFETVRRDWCRLSRNLQNQVLKSILEDGNEKQALELIKETIKKIKNREIDKKDILIRTQLKKPLDEYKAITPHVVAARKIKETGEPISIGMTIEYFIAETKKGAKKSLVREKVKLPDEKGEYNIQYYLERQILPAVENILEVFNINIKEVIDGKKQMKLDGF